MINSFRREAVALGTVLATVLIGSLPAQAGLWFNGPKAEGNWTDVGNWYTYYYAIIITGVRIRQLQFILRRT